MRSDVGSVAPVDVTRCVLRVFNPLAPPLGGLRLGGDELLLGCVVGGGAAALRSQLRELVARVHTVSGRTAVPRCPARQDLGGCRSPSSPATVPPRGLLAVPWGECRATRAERSRRRAESFEQRPELGERVARFRARRRLLLSQPPLRLVGVAHADDLVATLDRATPDPDGLRRPRCRGGGSLSTTSGVHMCCT